MAWGIAGATQNPRDLSSIRLIVCGGSASPLGLTRGFEEELKIPYMTGYGMTETSPLVSISTYLTHMQDFTMDEKWMFVLRKE